MSVYSWETAGGAHRHKKVKKTGTVVLHTDDHVDTAFDRLQREVQVERLHGSPAEAEEALARPQMNATKTSLMTAETAAVLQEKMQFTGLLPCQAQCYRGIFNGRDVILHSRTGSGKTLAYALPVIERHLLLERREPSPAAPGPFLLIFVFSNDLAVQTKSVLEKIYGGRTNLRVAVAGMEDLHPTVSAAAPTPKGKKSKKSKPKASTEEGESKAVSLEWNNAGAVDILIGTVRAIDEAIRGHATAAAETALEEAAAQQEEKLQGRKRSNTTNSHSGNSKKSKLEEAAAETGEVDSDAEVEAVNASDDDQEVDEATKEQVGAGAGAVNSRGIVSAGRVRAIVVDEVDLTLGPRFSLLGRRMKNLLKYIRKANGSMAEGLLSDFRAHHYLLCGATIPNWVLKAGFLGVKKYYYQLVAVGSAKLPPQLECFHQVCSVNDRVAVAVRQLTEQPSFNGRVVVFGKPAQLHRLEEQLKAVAAATAASATSKASLTKESKKGKKKSAEASTKEVSITSSAPVVRVMTSSKDEAQRIAAITDFNEGMAQVLLCTDVAARGLDFVGVDTVLMLNLPEFNMAADTFVHRAGRTARVGRAGKCVLLHETADASVMDAIAKSTHVVFKALPAEVAASAVAPAGEENPTAGSTSAKKRAASTATVGVASMKLIVRNPFRYTKPNIKVPTAIQVLEKNVTPDLRAQLSNVGEEAGSNGEVVRFGVPAAVAHEVKQQLWKYTLEEL